MTAIIWRDGALILTAEERAEWLPRFGGDAKLLDLALIAAAGDCQPNPNSTYDYVARVRAHLARLAMGKIERDYRYRHGHETPASGPPGQLGSTMPKVNGLKCYREGAPGYDAVLSRLYREDPAEAKAVARRGWVWVAPDAEAVGGVSARIIGRLRIAQRE